MKLAAWYHAYTDGNWTEPVLEHVDALVEAGFSEPVYLGLVGQNLWRGAAADAFMPLKAEIAVEADSGFEQVTLRAVREYAQSNEGAVLYCHSKGSADATEFRKAWRRSMTRLVISDWRANLARLEGPAQAFGQNEIGNKRHPDLPVQAVGSHWLTAERFPWAEQEFPEGTPFFGGNFWMARCDYLRGLPEPSERSRFDAERWIGLGNPRVHDLNPGWPAANLFV